MTFVPPDSTAEIDEFVQKNHEVFTGKVPKLGFLNGSPSQVMDSLGVPAGSEYVDLSSLRERYLATMVDGGEPDGLSRACCEASMARIHNRHMAEAATLKTSAGQCTPGKRCHVTPDGRLHLCEHGDEQRPIGHVDTGFDPARMRDLMERFRDFVQPRCQGCWAVRLCSKCTPQLAAGATLSEELFSAQCVSTQAVLERDLADYCRARSRNERCFDSLANRQDRSNTPLQ
jgi:radical SAM protein with 4Fe4S-binding SPASM domain